LLQQSVIGLETKAALDKYNIKPDIIIGCAGGGSNLGGLISRFGRKASREADYRILLLSCKLPELYKGKFAYDFCDTGMVCRLLKCTLSALTSFRRKHAGGLRYHGMAPCFHSFMMTVLWRLFPLSRPKF
jgi:tryptophan synthase beta chain